MPFTGEFRVDALEYVLETVVLDVSESTSVTKTRQYLFHFMLAFNFLYC